MKVESRQKRRPSVELPSPDRAHPGPPEDGPGLEGAGRALGERVIGVLLFGAGAFSILTTIGIVVVLVWESVGFFRRVPVLEFLTGTEWTPLFQPQHFGVLPLLVGSLLIALIASLIAVPIGLGSAIYLSEYAPRRLRNTLKPILEILAGVPTVVYGYFALTFVTPILRFVIPGLGIFNALSAGIVVGVMILPLIASLSEDAMAAVPRSLRQGAYALGATRFEVATRVGVGITSALFWALGLLAAELVAARL